MPQGWKNETFTVDKLAQYFRNKGFEVVIDVTKDDVERLGIGDCLEYMDLLALRNDKEWRVSAKSDMGSANMSTAFDTMLGQLLRRMDGGRPNYAIAMPATDNCKRQATRLSGWLKSKLRLHWFWVDEDGNIIHEDPSGSVTSLG